MFLGQDNIETAYRRTNFDARVSGAKPEQLVRMCFEQVVTALGSAVRAHEARDQSRKSSSLTRAHAALTALEMGIDNDAPLSDALRQLFASAREVILGCVTKFDADGLGRVRDDFQEIGAAFAEVG